jgi:hypothetical protein
MKYFTAIDIASGDVVFKKLYDDITTEGLDDYEVAQLLVSQILGLIFDQGDLNNLIKDNQQQFEAICIDLALAIKNDKVRDGVSLLAWIRLHLLRTVLPRIKELYVPKRGYSKPPTAAQRRKELEDDERFERILEQKLPEEDETESEPEPEKEPEPENIVLPSDDMETDIPFENPVAEPVLEGGLEEPVAYPEEDPKDAPEEPEAEEEEIVGTKRKKSTKNAKKKKQKKTASDGGILNVNDYLVIVEDIELKPDVAEPVIGYKRAVKRSKDATTKIVRATDYEFETRVWGAKIYPTIKFLKSGKSKLTETDVHHVGKFGVQEVNMCGNTRYHHSGVVYQFAWKEGKRWLNLSSIVEAIKTGSTPCILQRNSPYISPKGCTFTRDFMGNQIDENGNKVYDVTLEQDDEKVLRTSAVGYDTTFFENAGTMLDTGAKRNEISSKIAKALKLYDPKVQKQLRVRNSGTIVTTTGEYDVNEVKLDYIITAKNLFHRDVDISRYPPGHVLTGRLTFQYPGDPKQDSNFDILLGRNGIRGLGIKIRFNK